VLADRDAVAHTTKCGFEALKKHYTTCLPALPGLHTKHFVRRAARMDRLAC
jgi:hypothetical protein